MEILLCVTRRIQKSRNDEPLSFNPFLAVDGGGGSRKGSERLLPLMITLKLSLRCGVFSMVPTTGRRVV